MRPTGADRPLRALLAELALGDWRAAGGEAGLAVDRGHHVVAVLERGTAERIVLKERPDYLGEEEFAFGVRAQRQLSRGGAPIPGAPSGVGGAELLRAPPGRQFAVHEWIDGDVLAADSLHDLGCLGRALARFHVAAAAVEPEPGSPLRKEPRDRFGKTRFYRPLLQAGLPEGGKGVVRLDAHLDAAAAALASARADAAHQLLHGDVDLPNALRRGGECILLDLDDMHFGPRVSDLAWLITLTAAMERSPGPAPSSFRAAWSDPHRRAVLDGYRSVVPLSRRELAALRHWCVASVDCALVDCFHHDGWLIDGKRLTIEAARAAILIEALTECDGAR